MVPAPGGTVIVLLFAFAALSSAYLLFWIQPLFTKSLLPLLGGAPVVWNTALLFFQIAVLAGYGYAHLVSRLKPALQILAHAVLLASGLALLPPEPPSEHGFGLNPIPGLLALLSSTIGMPVLAVASTAPLLQHWFSRTGHARSDDPYFLYAASNLGSILALVLFPFLLEPSLSLILQRRLWSAGFGAAMALVLLAGAVMLFPGRRAAPPHPLGLGRTRIGWSDKLMWIALSGVPASLLLGVTEHITTDIASVPLLWILPLLVYLLTFVLAFGRWPGTSRLRWLDRRLDQGQAFALAVAGVWIWAVSDIRALVALHVGILFVLALGCHGRLAGRRPVAGGLTTFYVCVAFGGLLGGAFNTVLAPVLFNDTIEYGLAAVLACMLRPGNLSGRSRDILLDWGWPLALLAGGLAVMRFAPAWSEGLYPYAVLSVIIAFVIVGFGFKDRPLRYGLTVGAFLLVAASVSGDGTLIGERRSYFGSYDIVYSGADNANLLFHGTTIHGIQMLDPDLYDAPTSYYTESGPLGQVFSVLRQREASLEVGLVGLGIGTALCHGQPGDRWTVFEIDPLVFTIASDTAWFHQWSNCSRGFETSLVFGDARVRLRGRDARFDLLVLDAYSSDAIPVHLLTREALDLYRQRLRPGGLLLFHISNRHLALDRVLAGLSRDSGMPALIEAHAPSASDPVRGNASVWVVLAGDENGLETVRPSGDWGRLDPAREVLWTDDYSDVLAVLR